MTRGNIDVDRLIDYQQTGQPHDQQLGGQGVDVPEIAPDLVQDDAGIPLGPARTEPDTKWQRFAEEAQDLPKTPELRSSSDDWYARGGSAHAPDDGAPAVDRPIW